MITKQNGRLEIKALRIEDFINRNAFYEENHSDQRAVFLVFDGEKNYELTIWTTYGCKVNNWSSSWGQYELRKIDSISDEMYDYVPKEELFVNLNIIESNEHLFIKEAKNGIIETDVFVVYYKGLQIDGPHGYAYTNVEKYFKRKQN